MDLSSLIVVAVSIVFLLFFCSLVYYFHREKKLFAERGWVKVLAKEKQVKRRPFRNDGEFEVDLTCSYKFEVDGVEFGGRKAYFGDLLARLDEAEFESIEKSHNDFRDVVFYLQDDPRTSVAFFCIPRKLDDYLMYNVLMVIILAGFIICWLAI
jgi:hypothetical protein